MYSPPWDPYCPQGGKFYACGNGTKFVGCCEHVNPCTLSTGCSAGNLRQTSFDPAKYGTFHDQQCSGGMFYTCDATTPDTFFGCCNINPCANNGCPPGNLAGAYLSGNVVEAADMDPYPLVDATSITSSYATGRSTLTSTPTSSRPSSAATAATALAVVPETEVQSLPVAAIAGGAVGGFVLLCAVVGIVWLARHHATKSSEKHNRDSNAGAITSLALCGAHSDDILGKPTASDMSTVTTPYQDFSFNVPVYQNDTGPAPQYLASTYSLRLTQPQQYGHPNPTCEPKPVSQYRPYSPFNNYSSQHSHQSQLESPLSHISDPIQPVYWSNRLTEAHTRRAVDSQYSSRGFARVHQGPPQEMGGDIDAQISQQPVALGVHHIRDGSNDRVESSGMEKHT